MPISPGTRLGLYEVTTPLGAGGMGEVYRARDTKLGRSVAVKVLPDAVATDDERVARFQREAKSLAALNHPHIATLFGMEEADGRHFIVMELVEGETLAERIARGSLPRGEVLHIATQIAEALETAHESGIVHRDLKPANVKITPDDQVKVLDFGLARALETSPSAANLSHSPTLSIMATGAGMILGTAAYMSPEQAKGHPADHRSDVFAFGSVLYEMLTGREAFRGETVADILASVLARDPDWSALPADLHPRLVAMLKRCLAKARKQRWQAIGDVRAELEAIAAEPEPIAATSIPAAARTPVWKRVLPVTAASVAAAAITAALMYRPALPSAAVARFSVILPADQSFTCVNRRVVDVSPDGSTILYVANGRLYLRPVNALDARSIPGSDLFDCPEGAVFSPDGKWIVFWARSDRTLKRIAVTGGAALSVTQPLENPPASIAWHGSHLYYNQPGVGLLRLPENGGEPEEILKANPGEGIYGPSVLPGGDAMVFSSMPLSTVTGGADFSAAKIEAYSFKTKTRTTLVPSGVDASYVDTGHLIYGNSGVLYAVAFDPARLLVAGGPIAVIEGVQRTAGAALMQAAVSNNGVLAYVQGPIAAAVSSAAWQLALFDRSGSPRSLKVPIGNYSQPRISPDGKLLAFVRTDERGATLWVHDLSDTTAPRRLTFEGNSQFPVWTPDSQRIVFQSNRDGKPASVFVMRADGTSVPERLTEAEAGVTHMPHSLSPDGQHLLFDAVKENKWTLSSLAMRDRKTMRLGDIESSAPTEGQLSPDGKWFAYTYRDSRSGARAAVFVQPFPPTGARYQISPDNEDGHHAVWSRNGDALFYTPGPGFRLHEVPITSASSFAFAPSVPVNRPFSNAAPAVPRTYDVTAGPKGDPVFVGLISPGAADPRGDSNSRIDVVVNWFEELKARAPK